MALAYGVRSRRYRKRAVLVGAILALVLAANVFIAILIVTGLRPFEDVEDSGLAAVLPEERVLQFFGLREHKEAAAEGGRALAARAGGGGGAPTGGADSFPTGFAQQAAALVAAPGHQPVLVAPLAGTTANGNTFQGTLYIERFIVRGGQLFLLGRVSGTVTDSAGNVVYRVDDLLVRLPIEIEYVDGTLTIVLGDLLLPELGVTVELDRLVPDAVDASGPRVEAFLAQIEAVAQLVEQGASAEEVAGQLNELVSSAGTSYETSVRALSESGGGGQSGNGAGVDAPTASTDTTSTVTTPETGTSVTDAIPTATVDTTAVPPPPSASAKAKKGAKPKCPKGVPRRLCDAAP